MMNSKEALELLKVNYCDENCPYSCKDCKLTIIETDLNLLETLKKKLDRKVKSKEYKDEKSNTYRLSTLLTYEIKEKWNEKETELLRQFLLNLSGIQKDLNLLETLKKSGMKKKIKDISLEDIEEELGIDLITLFKALEDGVYYLNAQKELYFCQGRNLVISQKSVRVYRHHYKLFKDYGKTWALTKEELL